MMGLSYNIRAIANLAAVACLAPLMEASPKQAEANVDVFIHRSGDYILLSYTWLVKAATIASFCQ